MANPNIVSISNMYGKTSRVNLTTINSTLIVNNPINSGKLIKINVMSIANLTGSNEIVSVGFYAEDDLGGTVSYLIKDVVVPANSTLNVIDKSTQYYLEENSSIGAIAVETADAFSIICSYEEVS